MPLNLVRSPSTAGVAAEAPYNSSTSPMALRSRFASPTSEGRHLDPVGDFDTSPGLRSPDSMAVPRRLPSVSNLEARRNFRSYHKPIRADASSSQLSLSISPVDKQAVPSLSPNESPETGIIAIGMALGSPTQSPGDTMTAWRPQFMTTVTAGTSDAQSPNNEDLSKSKPRKWGIFARSKSKRAKGPDAGQAQPTSVTSPTGLSRAMSSAVAPRATLDSELQGAKRETASPRFKPISRSHTTPTMGMRANAQTSIPRKAIAPVPPAKDNGATPSRQRGNTLGAPQPSSESPLGETFLDVEIPDITMERYSIMFGHLLQNRSASSLLARRQATQDRLKAIKEGDSNLQNLEKGRPSPRVPPIWDSKISPMQPSNLDRGGAHRQSPRMRSNTSPAMMHSPSKSSFEGPDILRERSGARHIAESTRHEISRDEATATTTTTPTERPQLISKFHRQLSLNQKSSPKMAEERSPFMAEDARFQVHGQSDKLSRSTWNSTHPPHAESAPRSSTPKDAERSLSNSPVATGSVGSLSEENLEETPTDPVEVSIARQISVSRQQRAMLGPLQRRALENRQISETKSSTPRLVDPRQDSTSPKAMYRKSERVIVESA